MPSRLPPSASNTESLHPAQSPEELKEEGRKIRRLQMVMNMVMQVIAQDSSLTVDEASEMVADTRKAALAMFPDKELSLRPDLLAASAEADARTLSNAVRTGTKGIGTRNIQSA